MVRDGRFPPTGGRSVARRSVNFVRIDGVGDSDQESAGDRAPERRAQSLKGYKGSQAGTRAREQTGSLSACSRRRPVGADRSRSIGATGRPADPVRHRSGRSIGCMNRASQISSIAVRDGRIGSHRPSAEPGRKGVVKDLIQGATGCDLADPIDQIR